MSDSADFARLTARKQSETGPPHVIDDTPLDTPPQEKAGIFARRFRNAAQQFRNPSGRLARLHRGYERYAEYPAGLEEQCGKWIIQAHKAGLIPEGQKELRDLIEWHAVEDPKELPPGQQARYKRCPFNLFTDLCGGNMVTGTFRGWDARGRVILEGRRVTGGLMPRRADGHLDLSHTEQCAASCEWLADVIERAAAPPAAERGEGGKMPDGPFDADGFRFGGVEVRFGRAAKQYCLVVALWDATKNRLSDPRSVEDVISIVWGNDNNTEDSAFRQLCADTRRRLQTANCPLNISVMNGKVQLCRVSLAQAP